MSETKPAEGRMMTYGEQCDWREAIKRGTLRPVVSRDLLLAAEAERALFEATLWRVRNDLAGLNEWADVVAYVDAALGEDGK